MTAPPTADQALRSAILRLSDAGVDGAARDARWLLAHALGCNPGAVPARLRDPLTDAQALAFEAAISARVARQPVAQITGRRDFYGRSFRVTRATLDPRPDTELIVDLALSAPFARVLDLGTGTGAILLSVLAERPAATGVGTDISDAALEVARWNSSNLGLSPRADLRLSDWWRGVDGAFDLILSNPPYIAAAEMPALDPEVRDWEPAAALTDGADGLTAYRAILDGLPGHIAPGGRLIVETGAGQGEAVAELFSHAGLEAVTRHPDLSGRQRAVSGRWPGSGQGA